MRRFLTWLYLRVIQPYVLADITLMRLRNGERRQEHVIYVVHLDGGRVAPVGRVEAQPTRGPN